MEQTGDLSFDRYGAPDDVDHTMTPGNMDTQWHWHVAYRDSAKNMYRTTYQDQIHNRDVHVKSDFPAGYGGHNPAFRHDIRFKNSDLYRVRHLLVTDVSRDAKPNFDANHQGVPGFCYNPRGAKKVPTMGQIPVYGLKAPWAICAPQNGVLNYRKAPPMTSAMRRTAQEHRLKHATLPRSMSDTGFDQGAYEEPPPERAPAMAASESMPALPTAAAAILAPTRAAPREFAASVNLSVTQGSFGQTAQPNGSVNRALQKSLNQSSYKGAFALNHEGAPPS